MKLRYAWLFLAATPSFAADWQPIIAEHTGAIVQIDRSSIRNPDPQRPGVFSVWVKYDLSKNKEERARYALVSNFVDCDGRRIAVVSSYKYSASGSLVSSNETISSAVDVIPDSVGDAIYRNVCSPPVNVSADEAADILAKAVDDLEAAADEENQGIKRKTH